MVLEMIPEEPEDEYVDLFNLPEGEGAPPKRAGLRSRSGPSRFWFENDAAAERRQHITTIVDRPMVVQGTGVSRAYRAEITPVEEERARRRHRFQILRMADGSEFAVPTASSIYEREGPWDWADTSFLPPLPSPSQPDDSSWVQQPLGQQVAAERSYVSDEAFSAISGARNMPIFSPDMYPVTTPLSQQFREYSASDPGAQDVPEWRSVSDVQERSGSWHGSRGTSFEVSSPAVLEDVSSQDVSAQDAVTQSSHYVVTNNTLTRQITRPPALTINTGNDEKRRPLTATPTSTTLGQNVSAPAHLLGMVFSGKYSDLQIALDSASNTFQSSTFAAHRVIVSQSSVLSEILESMMKAGAAINLIAANGFSLPRGFEFALQRYYGLEFITKENVYEFAQMALGEASGSYGLSSDQLKKAAMELVLCYGSAGAFLNQPEVVDAAFNLVLELFDWSNLETALQFGLYPEDYLLAYEGNSNGSSSSSSNNNSNSNSNSNKTKGKKNRRTKRMGKASKIIVFNNLNDEVVHKWGPRIASAAINFLVLNLPSDYHFDRTGLSKDLQDRIPAYLRGEYSVVNRNPMLAGLTFGEHPAPTPEAHHASAILLALPFTYFREAVGEMRLRDVLTGDIVKAILQEREVRRISALQAHSQQVGVGRGDVELLRELGYREFAIHVQTIERPLGSDVDVLRNEYSLHREWCGIQAGGGLQSVIRKFGE
ncbi:hypothetical protein EYB25_008410 [Talaromyces marneffei]|nr:hypothetical protein EYB25_008410 [Talaromyces marneffei]